MTGGDKQQKEKMRNETVDVECGLRFDLSSTLLAPEVKVYQGQPPIFCTNVFFCNSFSSITPRATILPPLCSSRQDGSNDTQFDLIKLRSKFDLRSEVRSG